MYVCAFAFKERVEIIVFDLGQGIAASITKVHIGVKPKDALIYATRHGVSGHPNGSPGFGLYGSAQIARLGGGSLYIISGGYGARITDKSEKTFSIPKFGGTLISLGLRSGSNFALDSIINKTPREFFEDLGLEYE